jgi:hypothetical protein
MAVTINASTSSGLVQTADTSGTLQLQTAGTTALTLDASQNATFAGTVTATSYSGSGASLTGVGSITTLASNVSMGTGTSFTISGLTLTNYKLLTFVIVNATASAGTSYLSTITPAVSANAIVVLNTTAKFQNFTFELSGQTVSSGFNAVSGVTTASTSITFYCANTIATGTYYLYGMK